VPFDQVPEQEIEIVETGLWLDILDVPFHSKGLVHELALFVLESDNPLLHRAFDDHLVDRNVSRLADTVDAVNGLILRGGVPPGVHHENLRGRGEVKAETAALEGHQENGHVWVSVELGEGKLSGHAGHVSIQADKVNPGSTEGNFKEIQHRGPLAKDDTLHLRLLLLRLHQVSHQGVHLGAVLQSRSLVNEILLGFGL